jgi:Cu-Zn family superoxide dismutase
MKFTLWFGVLGMLEMGAAHAGSIDVPMSLVSTDGNVQIIGTITASETRYGLLFTPNLKNLPAGIHGFHVHEKGSCEAGVKDGVRVAALEAGGHFDPKNTGNHLGPYADGHMGDLPAIYVTGDGSADYPVLAPRFKSLSEIKGRALMIHAGADNHSDAPKPLGGGGNRVACGVI